MRIRALAPPGMGSSAATRRWRWVVADGLGLALAAVLAVAHSSAALSFGAALDTSTWMVGVIVATQLAANVMCGVYADLPGREGIRHLTRIIVSALAGAATAALIVAAVVASGPGTISVWPSGASWGVIASVALAVLIVPRAFVHLVSDRDADVSSSSDSQRTLLYGAGWAGAIVARSAAHDARSTIQPVGFLDDRPDLGGRRVGGLLVHGDSSALGRARRRTRASALLITMPRATAADIRRIAEAASLHGMDIYTIPPMTELSDGMVDVGHSRPVQVEDLLHRPRVAEHRPAVGELLSDRTIMITGASGRLGTELARQALALKPSRIVMVDDAESELETIARSLANVERVRRGWTSIVTHIADLTDRGSIVGSMRALRPAVVYHVAAHQRLSMHGDEPVTAAQTIIRGTRSIVDAVADCGVERFVLVSADEAAEPSTALGASMRIAEMIVGHAAHPDGRAYLSIRVNAGLGAHRNVIARWLAQLERGGPITLSDPDEVHHLMTIPEAAWLLLDASAMPEHGSPYTIDAGPHVKSADIVETLARMNRGDRDPMSIPVVERPIRVASPRERPGTSADVAPTEVPGVMRSARDDEISGISPEGVAQLMDLAGSGHDAALRAELLEYVTSSVERDRPNGSVQAVEIDTPGEVLPVNQPRRLVLLQMKVSQERNGPSER